MSTNYTEAGLKRMTDKKIDEVLAQYGLVRTEEDSKDDLVRIILEQQAAAAYKAQEDKELESGKETKTDRSLMGDQAWMDDRVLVIFDAAPGKEGKMPINVGLNGVAYQIPRDVEVPVPRAVLKACIGDARQTLFEPETDHQGRVQMNQREVPRFTYRVVADPAPEGTYEKRRKSRAA